MKLPFKIRFNKTWLVLAVSLGIGLLAALATRSFIASQMAAIEVKKTSADVKVVVANTALKKGDFITGDVVAVRDVPADFAHSTALMPAEMDRFDGSKLNSAVKPGEMILWSMLESKKAASFSERVETGRRAMTLPVDEINSISGLLEPGDRVDLLVTVDQKGKKITFPLVQNIRVMATGQRVMDDPKSGEKRQYSTVTLDATPEEAQTLVVAREAGKFTALLRNPEDKEAMRSGPSEILSLVGGRGEEIVPKVIGVKTVRTVPVLYGGSASTFPAEGLQLRKPGAASEATPVPTEAPVSATPTAPAATLFDALTAPAARQR